MDGGGDGCNTGVSRGRTTQDWGWVEGVTLSFGLRNGSGSVFGLDFCDKDLFLDWLLLKEGKLVKFKISGEMKDRLKGSVTRDPVGMIIRRSIRRDRSPG